jgi:predicted transcriptional regulator
VLQSSLPETLFMASVTTSVRIEQQLAKRLERAAARLARGNNWIISKALEEYLAKANRDSLAAEARRQSMAAARDEKRKLKGATGFPVTDFSEWK